MDSMFVVRQSMKVTSILCSETAVMELPAFAVKGCKLRKIGMDENIGFVPFDFEVSQWSKGQY
jgi:hypothetical protein